MRTRKPGPTGLCGTDGSSVLGTRQGLRLCFLAVLDSLSPTTPRNSLGLLGLSLPLDHQWTKPVRAPCGSGVWGKAGVPFEGEPQPAPEVEGGVGVDGGLAQVTHLLEVPEPGGQPASRRCPTGLREGAGAFAPGWL